MVGAVGKSRPLDFGKEAVCCTTEVENLLNDFKARFDMIC